MSQSKKHLSEESPLVSVMVLTYQHAKFIRQCLDGILSQQTDFNFEIVLGDDGSSDGTSEICREYQQQYPETIRLFVYQRDADRSAYPGGPGRYNFMQTFPQVRGDYIALCEGDDYWTDQGKLQTQVSFLEANPEFSACFHAVTVDTPQGIVPDFITEVNKEELQLADLSRGNCIHTPSIVYRNIFILPFPRFFNDSPVMDYLLHCYAAAKGKIKFIDRKMAAYRVHEDSYWSSSAPATRARKWFDVVLPLIDFFDDSQARHNFINQLFATGLGWLRQSQSSENIDRQYILTNLAKIDSERLLLLVSKGMEAPANVLDQALQMAERMNESLPKVINKLLNRSETEHLQTADKQDLMLQVVEYMVRKSIHESDYATGKCLGENKRQELYQAYLLINEVFDEGLQPKALTEAKSQIRQLIEHDEYQVWIRRHEMREVDAEMLAERMMLHWEQQPVMHCFMFVLPGEESLLADTVDTLASQWLKNWHLTVIAVSPAPDPIFEQADFLHWRVLENGDDPYQALNQEIARESSHWVSFIEPGVQYSPQSLAKIADAINLQPSCSFFYTDDDQVDNSGMRSYPRFKPDFNLDLLRSSPYIGNGWMPASELTQIGGIRALAGAENYDLALRWFESFGQSAFFHIADVLIHKSSQVDRPFDSKVGEKVLQQHLQRTQTSAEIEPGYVDNSYRVVYLHDSEPKVSIIIPTKDKLEFLQPCIESLLDKTHYQNYEVLVVDNQSTEPDTLDYYQQLTTQYPSRVRVLFYDKPFNFSAMNNWAAQQSNGELLVLLNNDTEIIHPEWLSRMVVHGQRPEVGVVGARLVYPGSGRVQHAGVILGMSMTADHPYNNFLSLNDTSHMERARLDQGISAVTAAMMMVKKDVYQQLGGMDEENLAVLFNDVDFCLRARQLGWSVVYTPFVIAVHHGSTTIKSTSKLDFYSDWSAVASGKQRTRKEQRYLIKTWLPLLANDPAYNPNLSLRHHNYALELNAPMNWDRNTHLRLRCYGVPIRGGSGDYRLKQPFSALSKSGMAVCEWGETHLTVTELKRLQPDTVVFQNAITDAEIETMQMYREFYPDAQIIFLLDDLLHELPEKSAQYKKMKAAFRDARSRLRKALSLSDRLIVSTQPLAAMCQDMIEDIQIIPNRLQKDTWLGLEINREQQGKPRVGWAGAQQHQGDLELIVDVVRETADEFDWVFFGMCPDEIKPYIKEEHGFVDIDSYPQKLASLNLDLAVAPLEQHEFNLAKSNLRLLEYGILGWPVVCSDILPYQTNNAPVVRVSNGKDEWIAAIRQILADPYELKKAGNKLKEWVHQHYLLEDHLGEWLSAFANSHFQKVEQSDKSLGVNG